MRRRWELVSPGVVIGLWSMLVAHDLETVHVNLLEAGALPLWAAVGLGFFAPYLGCRWVGRKHRSEGRDERRSLWITLTMGFIAGNFVFPIVGGVWGAIFTALIVLPPTMWIALLSMQGFRRSREGSFARTIWWRRRWHATVAICVGAVGIRLALGPPSEYTVALAAATAVIACACLLSLASMAAELKGLLQRAPITIGEGAYRTATVVPPPLVEDAPTVRAMMRHSLQGALALALVASSALGWALAGYLRMSSNISC